MSMEGSYFRNVCPQNTPNHIKSCIGNDHNADILTQPTTGMFSARYEMSDVKLSDFGIDSIATT